jgi:putative transposase
LSIKRQCELLDLARSTYYYEPQQESALNLEIMRLIDQLYTDHPTDGSRTLCSKLQRMGYDVNRKRIQRLMRLMGLEAIYPKKNLSKSNPEHKIYPYLLRDVEVIRVNQVWSADISVPQRSGMRDGSMASRSLLAGADCKPP